MKVELKVVVDLDVLRYAEKIGIPTSESPSNIADEFSLISDGHSWRVVSSMAVSSQDDSLPDVVQTILARPRNGSGGGIPLTRGEVAMLFLDGHAGDGPGLLDIRSQGYGDDNDWDGLTTEDVIEDENTAFVWTKWEPLELWFVECIELN